MSPHHIDAVSRCRLLQFLAASPLFARDALAEELQPSDPADWAPRSQECSELSSRYHSAKPAAECEHGRNWCDRQDGSRTER
jgi:hypothetical protein